MGWDGWGPQISLRQNVFETRSLLRLPALKAERWAERRHGGGFAFGDRGVGRQMDGWMD